MDSTEFPEGPLVVKSIKRTQKNIQKRISLEVCILWTLPPFWIPFCHKIEWSQLYDDYIIGWLIVNITSSDLTAIHEAETEAGPE